MPGAYAHIAAVHRLTSLNVLDTTDISKQIKRALVSNLLFCTLGAVSPDYPYLDITSKKSCEWADAVHHAGVDQLIKVGIRLVREMPESENRDICLAWLFGFVSHVCVDMTIHPIVEGIAGIYSESKENQKEHRKCEMHQDVHIWQELDVGTVGSCEAIDVIKDCSEMDDEDALYRPLKDFWVALLQQSYPELYAKNIPDIDRWHCKFCSIVDKIEESHKWVGLARHVAVNTGMAYPRPEEVDDNSLYIKNLKTPDGTFLNYKDIFDKAVSHALEMWSQLAKAVESPSEIDVPLLGDWNLDRGLQDHDVEIKDSGRYVFWRQNEIIQSSRVS